MVVFFIKIGHHEFAIILVYAVVSVQYLLNGKRKVGLC